MTNEPSARVKVATLLRELGHDFVERDVSDEVLSDVATRIESILHEIGEAPARNHDRSVGAMDTFREGLPQYGRDQPRHLFADSVVSGGANPMGLGAYLWRDGDQAVMEVTLGKAFEGAPQRAHGGIVAALLDETMGMVNSIHGTIGLTATLNITYVAATPAEGLGPASANGVYDNVILMASPVQLIRTVAGDLGAAIPQPSSFYTVSQPTLGIPSQTGELGAPVPCTTNFVSITGNLDPVGGYFFRRPYAYMNLPGQDSHVDNQQLALVNGSDKVTLESLLQSALQSGGPPVITPQNPHDWSAYVARHAADLQRWLS